MANKARGEVALTVDGRIYTLRLSINAICELETELERTGQDSDYERFFAKARRGSLAAARLLLWACLRDHHPSVTVADAGEMIETVGELAPVWEALAQAMDRQTPDKTDVDAIAADKGEKKTRPAAGTGMASARRRGGPA